MESKSAIALCFIWSVTAFLLAVAETAWANPLGLIVCSPEPLLVFCVCLGLYAPPDLALISGAICGLCFDLARGGAGLDSLLYLYIAAGCVWLGKRFYFRKSYEGMAVVFLVVWLYSFIMTLINGKFSPVFSLGNAGVSTLFVPMFRVIIRRKEV